jgi:hypothetical protein
LVPDEKEMDKYAEIKYWRDKLLKISDTALMIKLCDMLETLEIMDPYPGNGYSGCGGSIVQIIGNIRNRKTTDIHNSIIALMKQYLY